MLIFRNTIIHEHVGTHMTKQTLTILFFICFTLQSFSQNYKKVDSIVLSYPSKFGSPEKLADKISSDFSNEFEKVRALYFWITNNVIYDIKESGKFGFEYYSNSDLEKKEKKFNKKLSSRVVSKGKAVCEGYSTLFTEVCNSLNIKSKVVTGSSKTKIKDIGKRYHSDHAWNIVSIEDNDYLIDTTWGAEDDNITSIKNVNFFYFLTNPELFIKTHYPDFYQNSLLKEKIEKIDFLNEPLIYDHNIELIIPESGIIKKNKTKKVQFVFATKTEINLVSFRIDNNDYEDIQFNSVDNNIKFLVDFSKYQRARELTLYFDDKPIIGFKIE